jgi:hypothetical protein
MPLRSAIAALLVVAGPYPAFGVEPSLAARGGLELQLGAGWHDDAITTAQADATATGGAVSDLGVRGEWFTEGAHLGVAARVRGARFTLAAERGLPADTRVDVTGLNAGAALAARASVGGLTFTGRAGYGWSSLPVAVIVFDPAGQAGVEGGSLAGHGPQLGAGLRLAAGRVGLELAGEGVPVTFGADYAGTTVQPRWLAARAGATVDCCTVAGTRWSALASYEWSRITARGGAVAITQRQQQIGIGLRASWPGDPAPPRPPPPVVVPRPVPAPAPPPPPPPPPSAVSGVVRGEGGQLVTARVAIPELGLESQADDQGGFRFDVVPGQYTLVVEAEGWLPQRKPVTVGPGEQRIYNIELQRRAP